MKRTVRTICTLAGIGFGLTSWNVAEAYQAAGGAVAATPTVAAAPAAAEQAGTLWSFLGLGKDQLKECKEKLCKCTLVQMLNSMLAPMSAMTGGLIQPLCPTGPSAADLAKSATSAEGAAAKIKADEAAAKERRAAVRYLGTVDCSHWPEAEVALINALRADRNECVRYEAALSLANGCCCTRKIIDALKLTVEASDKDGNPPENSPRVKAAATRALAKCMACADSSILQPERPEKPVRPESPAPTRPEKSPPPPPPQPAAAAPLSPFPSRLAMTSSPVPTATARVQAPTAPATAQPEILRMANPGAEVSLDSDGPRLPVAMPSPPVEKEPKIRSGGRSLLGVFNYAFRSKRARRSTTESPTTSSAESTEAAPFRR